MILLEVATNIITDIPKVIIKIIWYIELSPVEAEVLFGLVVLVELLVLSVELFTLSSSLLLVLLSSVSGISLVLLSSSLLSSSGVSSGLLDVEFNFQIWVP